MDEQTQDDQLEPTYSGSVPIRNVALETCRKQMTIEKGGEKGSEISVLIVRHDDDELLLFHGIWRKFKDNFKTICVGSLITLGN